MPSTQRILKERRQYNQWVATETLEDYALRYTPGRARKTTFRVGNTALGPIAFLACEAIGGAITLAYGFQNAVWAIGAFAVLMFLIGLPIAYYAARYGVDIDLLTRGAGFGYMGSTLTSLIYASFTFLLFSIEASIMSAALHLLFGIPLAAGYLVSALVVIPIAIYGISLISRMQLATQLIWLVLQFVPIAYIVTSGRAEFAAWTHYPGQHGGSGAPNFVMFGMAVSILLSLLPQIGEQVDYLRFLPERATTSAVGWWTSLIITGPGWVLLGGFKLLVGSFLAFLALRYGLSADRAVEPTDMYYLVFQKTLNSPSLALILAGVFVFVCQLKINVTNAYAGSIAWSNFFSRLTHSHPGRVVWLVFNVILALLLMETGIVQVIDGILRIYANFAAGWLGAVAADLVINKPLGLSPPFIEFKRAHLYDINPVGVGALLVSILASSLAFLGAFGAIPQILSPFVALMAAFVVAPLIAWATGGKYYLAREPGGLPAGAMSLRCTICENEFERSDMALCPAYSGPICSLCCTLETRCRDTCKTNSRVSEQLTVTLRRLLPARLAASLNSRLGHFVGLLLSFNLAVVLLLSIIDHQYGGVAPAERVAIRTTLWLVFLSLLFLSGVASWLIVLAHESRRTAEKESERQTAVLMEEISAHKRTDSALQRAKEVAEAANIAKTRYIVGISHEIRTPLNSIFGYAQLLERGAGVPAENAARIIRRSSEHLSNLVDGLLDISRIENGLMRLSRDKVRLPDFLDQIVDMFRLQAAAKGISFRYQPPLNLPLYVYTDQKRLRQILINLLSNAIKYTESGHAGLVVRYRSQMTEIEVSDTGMGIDQDEMERIFLPFERGRDPSVRSIPGTGMGLTITSLLAQIMGGDITVRSVLGEGSTFTVRLLLSKAPHDAAESVRPRRISGYAGRRLTFVAADDDSVHLGLLRSLLVPLDFTLLTASNGRDCLRLAAEQHPDLVLLDISMPDMTGWEVARQLRTLPDGDRPRIVMVSANAHEHTPGFTADQAHDAFLLKPIDIELLLETVAKLLRIEWVYEPTALAAPDSSDASGVPAADCAHHLDDLYQLGRIGHVRGIDAKLKEIETENPANAPFAAHLRGLVSAFDLKQYMHILAAIRKSG